MLSRDGSTLISGSEDATALVWDVAGVLSDEVGKTTSTAALWRALAGEDADGEVYLFASGALGPFGTRGVVQKLVAACVADFNGDGLVNMQDFSAYLDAWGDRADAADVNGDGVVDTRDFAAFLSEWGAAFQAGGQCP